MSKKIDEQNNQIERLFEIADDYGIKLFVISDEDFTEPYSDENFTESQIEKLKEYCLDYIAEEWSSIKSDAIYKLKAKGIK